MNKIKNINIKMLRDNKYYNDSLEIMQEVGCEFDLAYFAKEILVSMIYTDYKDMFFRRVYSLLPYRGNEVWDGDFRELTDEDECVDSFSLRKYRFIEEKPSSIRDVMQELNIGHSYLLGDRLLCYPEITQFISFNTVKNILEELIDCGVVEHVSNVGYRIAYTKEDAPRYFNNAVFDDYPKGINEKFVKYWYKVANHEETAKPEKVKNIRIQERDGGDEIIIKKILKLLKKGKMQARKLAESIGETPQKIGVLASILADRGDIKITRPANKKHYELS
jgi:hypothetical protein